MDFDLPDVDLAEVLTGALGGFVSSLAAGALLLYFGYKLVDRRLQLEEANSRRRELDAQREENRTSVLEAVHKELESAEALLQTCLEELPQGGIPYPGFDTTGWPIVGQAVVFTTLGSDTIEALTHVYNRMASANEQLAFLSDLNHGQTAILATASAAGRLDNAEVAEAYAKFQDHRDAVRAALIVRLKELKPHLDNAIDAVEAELRRTSSNAPLSASMSRPRSPAS